MISEIRGRNSTECTLRNKPDFQVRMRTCETPQMRLAHAGCEQDRDLKGLLYEVCTAITVCNV